MPKFVNYYCATWILLLAVTPARADDSTTTRDGFVISRSSTPPNIDGILDDDVWRDAVIIDDFHQSTPRYREPATEVTRVRLLYDDHFLYVGAELRDSDPAGIRASQMIQGDGIDSDDRFFISVDGFNSKRNDYYFEVNANGIRGEALRENNSRFIADWVAIWHAESTRNETGWATEMAIPFKSISFNPDLDTWGINFGRWIIRKQELDLWKSSNRQWWAVDNGPMSGIENIQQGLGLDIVPSVNFVHRREYEPHNNELEIEPSLDIYYKITPSLNAALTINTDFSTAEVDQQQLALDRFLLFFPEKRDFFLQDAGIFEFANLDTNGRPFFSRRIGLSGDGTPIGIDAGGKLTGRIGRFNMGALAVRQDAWQDLDAQDLFVARASMNVFSESALGMIITDGDPGSNDSNNLVGTDFIFRKSDGLFGQIVQGKLWYQQTDSPGIDDNHRAYGAGFEFPNDRIQFEVNALEIQENFRPALGFVNRAGIRQYDSKFRYRTRPDSGPWREIDHQAELTLVTDMANRVLSRQTELRPISFRSHGGDLVFVEWERRYERVTDTFNLFGRLAIPAGSYNFDSYRVKVSSGEQRPVSVELSLQEGGFFGGDRLEKFLEFQWRQSAHFFLGLGFSENVVDLPSGSFTAHLGSLRTNIAFNSRWAWSNLIQYDNTAELFGFNSRLRYEPAAGRELLLVLNHQAMVTTRNHFDSLNDEVVLKLSYTFRY